MRGGVCGGVCTIGLRAPCAAVVKVSEYASWSSNYYGRAISACLEAAGAPADLAWTRTESIHHTIFLFYFFTPSVHTSL